jgi:hypothetical protein
MEKKKKKLDWPSISLADPVLCRLVAPQHGGGFASEPHFLSYLSAHNPSWCPRSYNQTHTQSVKFYVRVSRRCGRQGRIATDWPAASTIPSPSSTTFGLPLCIPTTQKSLTGLDEISAQHGRRCYRGFHSSVSPAGARQRWPAEQHCPAQRQRPAPGEPEPTMIRLGLGKSPSL